MVVCNSRLLHLTLKHYLFIRSIHSFILGTIHTLFQQSLINKTNFAIMRSYALLALAGPLAVSAASGSGHSTRYWDCCKPSCSWSGKASVNAPALTCDKKDNPISNTNAVNGCEGGGSAFACTNYSPWAVNDNLAYGFAATKLAGGSEDSWCCACYAYVSIEPAYIPALSY
jgi:hypothetical protein